ncbi:zeta toxin family protein [Streptomyces sp. NPDC020490]|uniref:zeta toxin family protein n=1 Tax=Streptomyces sp. NPDC020490 TaxID=3365078 RepID=UPI0037A0FF32
MGDPTPYELTAEQLQERFATRVVDYLFRGRRPSDRPVAILTGAQPAAGKSRAMAAIRQQNADRDVIQLSGDELRQFHPKFRELMATDPIAMVPATQQAQTAWMQMAFAYAVEHGYSFVAEGTFRDPDAVLADARFFATGRRDGTLGNAQSSVGGHEVWIVALAVRAERSGLDALYRFLAPGAEPGRWVWPEWAKASYDAIPITVAAAEDSPHVHKVIVTNRTGVDLFVNTRRPDGNMQHPPGAADAVLAERARPLPVQEADGWLARQQDVILQFVATGQVNTTTHQGLSLAIEDAQAIIPMSSAAASQPRLDAEAIQSGLSQVLEWARQGAERQRPLFLVPDAVIDARLSQPDIPQNPLRAAEIRAELNRRAALSPTLRAAEDAIRTSAQSLADLRRVQPGGTPAPAQEGPGVSAAAARSQNLSTADGPSADRQDRPILSGLLSDVPRPPARPFSSEEVADWLGLHQQVVVELAVRGQIDATSIPVLQQVAVDAETVAAMDPDPQSPARLAHTAVRPLLQTLSTAPITPDSSLPLLLTPDEVLTARADRIARATVETAPDAAETRTSVDPVQRLIEQGAPPELIERARTAAQEDQAYAQAAAQQSGQRVARLREEGQRISAELERRQALTPVMRQAENALRQRLHDRLASAAPSPQSSPSSAPRMQGPQQRLRF